MTFVSGKRDCHEREACRFKLDQEAVTLTRPAWNQ